VARSSKYEDLVAYMRTSKKSYRSLHVELLAKKWSETMIKKAHKQVLSERLASKKIHSKTIKKHEKEAKEMLKPRSKSFLARLSKNVNLLDEDDLVSVLTKKHTKKRTKKKLNLDELFDDIPPERAGHFYTSYKKTADTANAGTDVIKEAVKLAQQVVGQKGMGGQGAMNIPRSTQLELEKEALEEEKKMLAVQKELLKEEREMREEVPTKRRAIKETKLENTPSPEPKKNMVDFQKQMASFETELKNMDVSRATPKNKLIVDEIEFSNEPVGDRARTAINGLDPIIQGGLRRLSTTLIAGGPGSGKSIFGMEFLIQGIEKFDEPGLLVTFEQGKQDLDTLYENFGWDLEKYVDEKKLAVMRFTPEQIQKILESGGGSLRDVIDAIGANRIVIDSMSDLLTMYKSDMAKRRMVIDFFQLLHKFKCTSLIIAEQETDPSKHISSILEYQVDGVILLYNERIGDIRQRSLEIFKMRGTKHAGRIFPMKINDAGISILTDLG
jgi:circadian clock protein KaiC